MRVALAHGELGAFDGSSRYLADVAGWFAEQGHEVSFFCRRCTRELPGACESGVVLREPHEARRSGVVSREPSTARGSGVTLREPGSLADGESFDLLYGSDLELLAPLRPRAARFFYAPLDLLASDADAEREALANCDRLLRFTRGAVELLERHYQLPLMAKSLVAVYVSQQFEGLGEPPWKRPFPPELLWVGRLLPSKNVTFLLRAAALLRTPDWRLTIAGTGPEQRELLSLRDELGLGGRVAIPGAEPELSPLYARASLFLTASRSEHYSLTPLEAAAHGVPCLGLAPDGHTILNACDEQIVHGVTGCLFHDEPELARLIDELLGDEPRRAAMARAAWQRKRERFTLPRFWEALRKAL